MYEQSRGGGGGTPIHVHKLYGDVLPFRVWFFDCSLINCVSNSKILEDFYKWGLKITNYYGKVSGIWPDNHKQDFNFPWFSWTFYRKQGQGFKVRVAPPYPNLSWVPPWVNSATKMVKIRLGWNGSFQLNINMIWDVSYKINL